MADDPTQDPDPKKEPEPKQDPPKSADDLGDAGKKALDQERKARRDAEKALQDVQAKLKELEDKDKSETDKLREQVDALTKERDLHASAALRHQVALSKGLTAAQAKRLVGSTQEELEADADEILEAFPAKAGATPPPSNKPKPNLKGGGDPTDEPTDVKALIDSIPPVA
jgi:hypothetical protein